MDEKPKKAWRRWFQFRLSTWFVLMAILCWAMATRPYLLDDWDFANDPFLEPDQELTQSFNPRLKWPALALVAFIGWKAFWLIRERRKTRKPPTGD